MNENGFVKVPRALFNSRYTDNPVMFRLILMLIAMARFVPEEYHGVFVDVNQIMTTKKILVERLSMPRTTLSRMLGILEADGIISLVYKNRTDILITVNILADKKTASDILKKKSMNN